MAMDEVKLQYTAGKGAGRRNPSTALARNDFPANAVVCLSNGELSTTTGTRRAARRQAYNLARDSDQCPESEGTAAAHLSFHSAQRSRYSHSGVWTGLRHI